LTQVEVKVEDSPVTPVKVEIEDKVGELATFNLDLPERQSFINLGAALQIKRDNEAMFKGVVEKIEESYSSEGYLQSLSGRDLTRNLAVRMFDSYLFRNVEPKDIIRILNRPSLRLTTLLFRGWYGDLPLNIWQFDADYEEWWASHLYYYEWFHSPNAYCYHFRLHSIEFPYPVHFENFLLDPKVENPFILHSLFRTQQFPVTNYPSESRFGNLVLYKDEQNFVAACIRTSICLAYQDMYLALYQVLNGVETQLAETFIRSTPSGGPGAPVYGVWQLDVSLSGTTLRARVTDLQPGYYSIVTASGTIDPSLQTDGQIGLWCYQQPIEGWMEGTVEFFKLSAINGPYCESYTGSGYDIVTDPLNGTSWTNGENQAAGQYLKFDLGANEQVCEIRLIQDKVNFARNFKIEHSTDGENWTEIVSKTDFPYFVIAESFPEVTARYLKITITASAPYHWTVNDMRISKYYSPLCIPNVDLDSYGEGITIRFDRCSRLQAMKQVANLLGWHLWVDADGVLKFKASRGTDKSETVKFKETVDILSIEREHDVLNPMVAGTIVIAGHGLGQQKRATSSSVDNETLIENFPELEEIEKPSAQSGGAGVDAGSGAGAAENSPGGMEDQAEDWSSDDWSEY